MIHNRQSTATSVGATIGTFDPVNTRNGNNLLPSGCTGIYGMTYVGSRVAFTAALSKQTRLRITHPASGFNNDDFLVGALTGAGIATNDQAADIAIAEFIPLQREGNLGGSSVNFFVSDAGQAATDASSVCAGPVSYTAQSNLGGSGSPPKEWFDGRVSWPGHALPYQGSVGGAGAITGTAANAGTDLGNAIVRAEYNVICGFRLSMAPKVVGTAGEEAVAWGAQDTALSSTSNTSPQEWPFNAVLPTLGTPVGSPVAGHVYPMPAYIALPANDVTVDFTHNFNVAVTTGLSATWGAFLRK